MLDAMAEMEFAILDNGLRVEDGRVKYQWFMLAEPSGRSVFRAVALRELTYLPTRFYFVWVGFSRCW
jgi:hypothetical protein